MQFAEYVRANWQEGFCFIVTMPDPIQPEQLRQNSRTKVPYSSDLAPSDFPLFGPLRNHLGGKRFADDEEVETEVRKWLRQHSKDFTLRISTH
jgi:hypothetical protein